MTMTDTAGRRYMIVPNTAPACALHATRPRRVRALLCRLLRHQPEAMWFVDQGRNVVRLGCRRCRRPLRWALG